MLYSKQIEKSWWPLNTAEGTPDQILVLEEPNLHTNQGDYIDVAELVVATNKGNIETLCCSGSTSKASDHLCSTFLKTCLTTSRHGSSAISRK